MPLPDRYENEPTIQLDPEKVNRWREARANAEAWQDIADKIKAELVGDLGDATAGKIGDDKVITYRPSERYAEARIRQDHPDLVPHFMRTKTQEVFDMAAFRRSHPEIAEQYHVRQFRLVEE